MLLLLLGLTGLAFLYVMLVPPGTVPRRARPKTAALPAPENAWTEYSRALADLGREPAPAWLREATMSAELTADERAYLARHLEAVARLRAGSTRARFEYFEEAPTIATPVPDLQRLRQLAELAAAEARRLRDAGDAGGALELETTAYHYGTDLAQLDAGLLLPVTAAGCRRSAAAALFASLGKDAPPAAVARAARTVALEDSRMPSAWQATDSEWRLIGRTVEDGFLGPQGPAGPSAFRLRVFASFQRQHDAVLEEARPHLESWDFPGLQSLDERMPRRLQSRAAPWRSVFLVDNMAARITAGVVPPLGRPARLLYTDRANGAAFQLLAACRAWQLSHGRLPADPADALAEAGLRWPLDPVTRRPVGYRLDGDRATVWLAGFDGKDDGGRAPYLDLVQATIAPGTDLIYRTFEMPPTLRTLGAGSVAHPGP